MKIRALIVALLATLTLAAPVAAQADTRPDVLAVGDSITQGVGASTDESWPERMGAERAGQSGGCIIADPCFNGRAMVHTYRRDVLPRRPDVVIIAYGINDLASAMFSPKQIVEGIEKLARKNKRHGIRTYVATLTPLRGYYLDLLEAPRQELNALIRARFKGRLIDFDAAIRGESGRLRLAHDSGDGLHPNARAYRAMARAAAAVVY